MPILHSFEENKLEYEDEDEVRIKMMGIGMDKESLEHNLYENDITLIICHNFSLTSNPPSNQRIQHLDGFWSEYTKFDIKRAYRPWRRRHDSLRRRLKAHTTTPRSLATASE
ncbi:hypothetical protein Tco_0568742 [Tanacetum coccineum]